MSEPKPSPLDDLQARAELAAAEAALESAAKAAVEGASKAGNGLLDALEVAIFGRVGGAEATLAAEKIADPLERLRAKYGDVEVPRPAEAAPRKEDPVARAKAELERLKAAQAETRAASGDPGDEAPVKKTL
jgi:hypothetical protein